MSAFWPKLYRSRSRSFHRRQPGRVRRPFLELLEARLALTTAVSLDPGGNLLIEDVSVSGNDNLTIKSDTANRQFVVSDPGTPIHTAIDGATGSGTGTVIIPFAAVTGNAILVNTYAGDDVLTVDLSVGDFAKTVTYSGGANGSTGDELSLQGGATFANVTHTFENASSGSIAISGNALISYSGLEPIADSLSVENRVFTFNGGAETIALVPAGGSSVFNLAIDSNLGEIVFFHSPTNSLTIDAGTGDDTVNVNGIVGTFPASLNINGGAGHDRINLNGDITFAANRSLEVDLQDDVTPNPGVDHIFVAADANYALSGTGTATLKVSGGISFAGGSSLATVDGALRLEANGPGTADATFAGVSVASATVQSTGTGAVQVLGRGGGGGSHNHGVRLTGAATIKSGTGSLQVMGTGGVSAGSPNSGVFVEGPGAVISSTGGNVSVSGTGGGTGASSGNTSVLIRSSQITAGGAGAVTVQGTGGTTSGGPNRGIEMQGGTITSFGGNVQVTGIGGATAGFTNGTNMGVLIQNGAQITAGGMGAVAVHGTGSMAGGVNNHGVAISGTNAKITSGGGNIQVTGVQGAGSSSFGISVSASGSIASVGAANIELASDSMGISAPVNGGSNTVTLRQLTAGTAITLNGADAPGVLGLTDAELDLVTAGTLNIGDTSAGTLTVNSTVSRPGPTLMNLTTGSDIALQGLLHDPFAVVNLVAPSGSIRTPAGASSTAPDVRAASVNVDGTLAPGGTSAGELAIDGSLVFSSTDVYRAQINGAQAFTQYDVISTTGTASLGSAILEVVPGFTPFKNQLFTIVNTTGGVSGVFRDTSGNPLPEGATLTAGGISFAITYAGGADGRDVVLRALTGDPAISISDASVTETTGGTTTVTFNVTLSAPGNQTIAVNWATADGSAVSGSDYVGQSGTVAFGVGDISEQVTITVNGDPTFEANESFVVNLTNPVGATITDGQAVGTILNDDAQPTVSINGLPELPEGGVPGPLRAEYEIILSNPAIKRSRSITRPAAAPQPVAAITRRCRAASRSPRARPCRWYRSSSVATRSTSLTRRLTST